MTYDVKLVHLQPQPVAVVCGTEPVAGISAFLGKAFGEVMAALGSQDATPSGMPFARYREAGDGFEIEAGFPVDAEVSGSGDVVTDELPGGTAAQTMHVGSYDTVSAAYEALGGWLHDHGYQPAGAPWEQYLDEPTVPQPRTLITFPCAAA